MSAPVLQQTLRRVSAQSSELVERLRLLVEVLYAQGWSSESLTLTSIARDLLDRSGADPVGKSFPSLLRAEGQILVALRDYYGALESYNRIRANLGTSPALQRAYGRGDANWALALIKSGKLAEGADMLRELLKELQARMGANDPQTGIVQGELGMTLATQGDRLRALSQFQPAVKLLLKPHNLNERSFAGDAGTDGADRRGLHRFARRVAQ